MPAQVDHNSQNNNEAIVNATQNPEFKMQADNIENKTSAEPPTPNTASNIKIETALDQAEQLQAKILNDEDFDFSQLEATAAGLTEQGSFASPPIIQTSENTIEYHSLASSINNNSLNNNETRLQNTNENTPTDTSKINDDSGLLESAPSIIGEAFANVTEDFLTSTQGSVSPATSFNANTQTTAFGEISYNEQGDWQYTLNNQLTEIQALGAGDILTESIAIKAQDGNAFFVEITINGSNDLASISGTTHASITEDAKNESSPIVDVSGTLIIEDIDRGEARFVAESEIKTTYGFAEINTSGEWHYILDNEQDSVQSLTNDSHLTDYFSVRSLDGTNQTIQITIQGTDDKPFLNGSNLVKLDLNTDHSVSGQLGINDPDFGESHFQANEDIAGNFGTGSIEENGSWTYKVNTEHPDISSLSEDAIIRDTFVVTTADGTEQTIIIPITNTNTNTTASSFTTNNLDTEENLPVIELSSSDDLLVFNTSQTSDDNADIYIWNAGNNETSSTLNTDSISQFTIGSGGDILQLNDLLLESQTEDELDQFLHFSFNGQDTTIEINTDGQTSESQLLVLNNVDLTSFGNSDNEIIHQLIQQGNLDIVGL